MLKKNLVTKQMNFVCRDIRDGISDLEPKFDVIVSNPPYIKTDDLLELQQEVIEYEPVAALDGGDDGLDLPYYN